MASNTEEPVKIDIIGGYLGAGKTTFLNKLMRDGLGGERVAIIENEFGEEPVDDAIVDNPGFSLRTLASGCICCSLKADFITCIDDIVRTCSPTRILIEPTGLASPAELESTCNMAARLKNVNADVCVNSMTAIVDATDAAEMIEYEIPVYMHQIEQARLIVLSHTQELDAGQLAEARTAVESAAQPHVVVIDTPWSSIDALEILALSEQAYANGTSSHGAESRGELVHGAHGHEGHHHSHEGFSSTVLRPIAVFDGETLAQLNDALRAQNTSRAKGFLPAPDGGLLHYEYVNGRARVTETSYPGPAKLVIIGMHLDADALAFVERR